MVTNIPSQNHPVPSEPSVGTASLATDHIMSSLDSKPAIFTPVVPPPTNSSDSKLDGTHISPAEQTESRSNLRLTFILAALFLSLFVAALDATIVATAIPVITHELNSATGYTWIGAAYLIANAVGAPIWGKLSDIWGRKVIMLSAVTVFFASSTICATATTIRTLIAGRALQGAAGGGLILLVHVVISDVFSMRRRSLFMGITEAVWAAAGGLGPPLGGIFASLVSWRWCFYINLPICGVAFVLLVLFLDVKHEKTSFGTGMKAMDWWGLFSFLAFSLMILLGLDFGGVVFAWDSAKVICLIVIGAVMLGVFVYSEARLARYPLIPLNLFRDKSNLAALGVTAFHGLAFIPGEYYVPLYLQAVKGKSPVGSGVLLVPLVVATASVGVLSGVVIHRTGRFRELIWVGTALLCLADGMFIRLSPETSLGEFIGLTILFGCGAGMLFEPPLIAVQSRSKQEDVTTATSTVAFIRSMAVAVSVVIGGVVFQNSMDSESDTLSRAGLPANVVEALSGKEAAANVALAKQLTDPLQQEAVKQAFAFGLRNMWILYTVLAGMGVLSGFFVGRAKLSSDHVETVTGIKQEKSKISENIEMA
ncbi:hypothetical protein PMZ80_004451 [Knufia obscura]|uniref:Major facilitator superfamily (MFS) profile domain-containing protein n=1 Tax=Knufia obscura TaxID=1635080 RepID=A0ABR0RT88_9EURO|nr:hypothetical protein PMZ80_004451 [Knufia obscura]